MITLHHSIADRYGRITDRPGFEAALPPPEQRLFSQEFYPPWPVEAPDAG